MNDVLPEGVSIRGELAEPARYFPVSAEPLRMKPGLHKWGTDFGNGERDRYFFQVDNAYAGYLREKADEDRGGRSRLLRFQMLEDEAHLLALRRIANFVSETAAREAALQGVSLLGATPLALDASAERVRARFDWLMRRLQEDAVVVRRMAEGGDRVVMMHVSVPGSWRPEERFGTSFMDIHRPVPNFAVRDQVAAQMVHAMVARGPYVRFVWSTPPDDALDHHPDLGAKGSWRDGSDGFLRVERQLTVPFPEVDAGLFLIRTYVYPFASLRPSQRTVLRGAIDAMPEEVARYKGLHDHRSAIAAALDRAERLAGS